MPEASIPAGASLVRATPVFDVATVPEGLRSDHRIAAGVWGRLVVEEGAVRLVFQDDENASTTIEAGCSAVIPPDRLHHVILGEGARFFVEFHRLAPDPPDTRP